MIPRRPQSFTARGFTLIEILIIAALIALLSGIAVFNVKQVMDQARVKATYADIRTVADSLSNAHMDLSFFPKIGFLSLSQPQLLQNANALPEDFETMGFATSAYIGAQRTSQVVDNWNGPYFNASGGRSALKTNARGYYTQMRMPKRPASNAAFGPLVDWPSDPWGNPYVVYLIHQDKAQVSSSTLLYLPAPAPRFVNSPYEEPNYFAAVVSYGPNGIPGGSADPHFTTTLVRNAGRPYRLFDIDPAAPTIFVALRSDQLELTIDGLPRINSLSSNNVPGAPFGYMGAGTGPDNSTVPGILDPTFTYVYNSATVTVMGSDDIIVPIR